MALAAPLATGDAAVPPPQLLPLEGLPEGRGGLDWSKAGCHDGLQPLPAPPPRWNVREFGAEGDGTTDDTAALQVRSVGAARGWTASQLPRLPLRSQCRRRSPAGCPRLLPDYPPLCRRRWLRRTPTLAAVA